MLIDRNTLINPSAESWNSVQKAVETKLIEIDLKIELIVSRESTINQNRMAYRWRESNVLI